MVKEGEGGGGKLTFFFFQHYSNGYSHLVISER